MILEVALAKAADGKHKRDEHVQASIRNHLTGKGLSVLLHSIQSHMVALGCSTTHNPLVPGVSRGSAANFNRLHANHRNYSTHKAACHAVCPGSVPAADLVLPT